MHRNLRGCAMLLLCAGVMLWAGPVFAMPISQYPSGGRERVTAKIDAPYEEFFADGQVMGSVEVAGRPLSAGTDYHHRGGSIVIELTQEYLMGLEPGTYPITVRYAGGEMQSSFTVGVGETLPDIRSGSPWVFLLGASLITLIGVSLLERWRKEQQQAVPTPISERAAPASISERAVPASISDGAHP